ncbi:MAG: hypothetical protein KGL75_00260 [Acidobacteriota bacterium]|nr:hypothetical protein [Acidobacteriota bacterium]
MTNRREFLHLGVAALSLPIAARAGVSRELFAAVDKPEAGALPVYKVIFDERYAACRAFADELERRGLAICGIRGDITGVWFNDLYDRWKQEPAAIAGMTAAGPIFCLEMLARDAGMRVTMRVDHRPKFATVATLAEGVKRARESRMEHEFSGPDELLTRAREMERSDRQWPGHMAELVAQFPAERGRATKAWFSSQADSTGESAEQLVTWVIAPGAPRRTKSDKT